MSGIIGWLRCRLFGWHDWHALDWGEGWIQCPHCGRVDLWLGEEK